MMPSPTLALAILTAMLSLTAAPHAAQAGDSVVPQVTDPAGDANGLNGQGFAPGSPSGPDTRPASIGGADIISIWMETDYTVEKTTDPESGRVISVKHVPTALEVHVRTLGAIRPTFGPSLAFVVPTEIDGCEVFFEAWIKGPAALNADPEQAALGFNDLPGCRPWPVPPGPAFPLTVSDTEIVMAYPFAMLASEMSGHDPAGNPRYIQIKPGTEIQQPPVYSVRPGWGRSNNYPHVLTAHHGAVLGKGVGAFPLVLDETDWFPGFTVGSDVPSNIECVQQPAHPQCT